MRTHNTTTGNSSQSLSSVTSNNCVCQKLLSEIGSTILGFKHHLLVVIIITQNIDIRKLNYVSRARIDEGTISMAVLIVVVVAATTITKHKTLIKPAIQGNSLSLSIAVIVHINLAKNC